MRHIVIFDSLLSTTTTISARIHCTNIKMVANTLSSSLPQLVILLVTDQFRYDAFQPHITPHLYHQLALAENATTFTNAYVSTPVCTPARAALLTGKSPWNHGMLGYGYTVNCTQYTTTLPAVMKEWGGYQTFAVGKNHFGWKGNDGSYVGHGFDHLQVYDALEQEPHEDEYMKYFDHLHPGVDPLSVTCNHLGYNDWKACPYGGEDEDQHPTSWTTRQALKYLTEFDFDDSNNKMFLKVSHHRPHSPYDPPARLFDKYMSSNNLVPKRFINNTSWDAKFLNTTGPMTHAAWNGDPGEAAAHRSRAGYLASVEFVDEGMGQLFDWLKNANLWDRSMIVWTTDHGDMNGDHNLWRKGYPWEQDTHVNLIMKLPSSSSSSTSTTTTSATTAAYTRRRMEKRPLAPQASTTDGTTANNERPMTNNALVETRDIAVTIYDFLGLLPFVLQTDPLVNGKSLMPLLGPDGANNRTAVRQWLDLELSTCYSKDVHWNAIVGSYDARGDIDDDGSSGQQENQSLKCQQWKYIFNVLKGNEQLFCLTNDPNETYDLATVQEFEQVLIYWRETMVNQFEAEKRGPRFVKDGKLVAGRPAIIYAGHFPCRAYPQSSFPEDDPLWLDGGGAR